MWHNGEPRVVHLIRIHVHAMQHLTSICGTSDMSATYSRHVKVHRSANTCISSGGGGGSNGGGSGGSGGSGSSGRGGEHTAALVAYSHREHYYGVSLQYPTLNPRPGVAGHWAGVLRRVVDGYNMVHEHGS